MKNEEFAKKYGNDLAEEIFNCFYDREDSQNVSIHSIHKIDSINYEFMATIYKDGEEVCEVSCRDGNWNGSEILDFGDIATPKRYSIQYNLGIADSIKSDPEKYKRAKIIFNLWKKESWFKEMQSNINYDFHFDPCTKTKNFWKEKASKKGLQIESETVEVFS